LVIVVKVVSVHCSLAIVAITDCAARVDRLSMGWARWDRWLWIASLELITTSDTCWSQVGWDQRFDL